MLAMHIDRNSNAADLRSSFLRSISTGSSAPQCFIPPWEYGRQFLVRPLSPRFFMPITLPDRPTPSDTRSDYGLGTVDVRSIWASRAVLLAGLHIGIGGAGTFGIYSDLLLVTTFR
jgi:hypothetical protein